MSAGNEAGLGESRLGGNNLGEKKECLAHGVSSKPYSYLIHLKLTLKNIIKLGKCLGKARGWMGIIGALTN